MSVIALIGIITVVLGATFAIAQKDIKIELTPYKHQVDSSYV